MKRRDVSPRKRDFSTNLSTRLVKKLVFVLFGPRDSIYELNRVGEHDETRARRISSARISPLSFYAVSRDLSPSPPSFPSLLPLLFLMESSRARLPDSRSSD